MQAIAANELRRGEHEAELEVYWPSRSPAGRFTAEPSPAHYQDYLLQRILLSAKSTPILNLTKTAAFDGYDGGAWLMVDGSWRRGPGGSEDNLVCLLDSSFVSRVLTD